jgi:glycosyltransferase involved in cell wall biosynthesis
MKKRIIHLIDDLGRGGAETTLVDLLPNLNEEYELILVTLGSRNDFDPAQIQCKEWIRLGYSGIKDIPKAVRLLKEVIREKKPDLVRSQLYYSTIVARLACPKDIPLVFSVHATMNEDPIAPHKRFFLYWLEKLTYRKRQHMVGVTQAVVDSFTRMFPDHGPTHLLHNFARDAFFNQPYKASYDGTRPLRLVCVSNIRLIKNIPYLVEAMQLMREEPVLLHIYGDGPMKAEVEARIQELRLTNVELKGRRNDIWNVLPDYDLFVSPSTVEGFGIAVAEAMSIGLPVVISDIPVYREIGSDKAFYLDNQKPESLLATLRAIIAGRIDLAQVSTGNKEYARNHFTKQGYLTKLRAIYQNAWNA